MSTVQKEKTKNDWRTWIGKSRNMQKQQYSRVYLIHQFTYTKENNTTLPFLLKLIKVFFPTFLPFSLPLFLRFFPSLCIIWDKVSVAQVDLQLKAILMVSLLNPGIIDMNHHIRLDKILSEMLMMTLVQWTRLLNLLGLQLIWAFWKNGLTTFIKIFSDLQIITHRSSYSDSSTMESCREFIVNSIHCKYNKILERTKCTTIENG